ncbi:hypothetical protein CSKR_113495 [Clonorchis sinensis]|uniref:Uncharacterized protein n=1 Tax=Clonorchis sinensis TaxID=79923 RepID=A0A419PGB3_CLOSI|nr:hypothetical protein CSKR_113495 [Clonorchis sinensis]
MWLLENTQPPTTSLIRWIQWPRFHQNQGGEMALVLHSSNPTSASRLPLSKSGEPDSIPDLVLPSGDMAVRHRKGTTAKRRSKLHSGIIMCREEEEVFGQTEDLRVHRIVQSGRTSGLKISTATATNEEGVTGESHLSYMQY